MFYWAVATVHLPLPANLVVPALSALGISTYVSSALVTGSVFKIIVLNTGPGSKGSAVGAAKGYVGLGSGAYACIFEAIRKPGGGVASDLDFLPMAAFFAVTAASIPAICLLPPRDSIGGKRDAITSAHFRVVFLGLLGLGLLVVGSSILSLYKESSARSNLNGGDDSAPLAVMANDDVAEHQSYAQGLLLVLMWFGPILSMLCLSSKPIGSRSDIGDLEESIPINRRSEKTNREVGNDNVSDCNGSNYGDDDGDDGDDLCQDVEQTEQSTPGGDARQTELCRDSDSVGSDDHQQLLTSDGVDSQPAQSSQNTVVEDLTLVQMLQTAPAWLMLWTCTVLAGGGVVITTNVGQMVEALRFDPSVSSGTIFICMCCGISIYYMNYCSYSFISFG